jgi:hypothetical protein
MEFIDNSVDWNNLMQSIVANIAISTVGVIHMTLNIIDGIPGISIHDGHTNLAKCCRNKSDVLILVLWRDLPEFYTTHVDQTIVTDVTTLKDSLVGFFGDQVDYVYSMPIIKEDLAKFQSMVNPSYLAEFNDTFNFNKEVLMRNAFRFRKQFEIIGDKFVFFDSCKDAWKNIFRRRLVLYRHSVSSIPIGGRLSLLSRQWLAPVYREAGGNLPEKSTYSEAVRDWMRSLKSILVNSKSTTFNQLKSEIDSITLPDDCILYLKTHDFMTMVEDSVLLPKKGMVRVGIFNRRDMIFVDDFKLFGLNDQEWIDVDTLTNFVPEDLR